MGPHNNSDMKNDNFSYDSIVNNMENSDTTKVDIIFNKVSDAYYRSGSFNPIPRGVWNYVNPWGGAIMARIDFKLYKSLKTLLSAHNLLSKQYFDL